MSTINLAQESIRNQVRAKRRRTTYIASVAILLVSAGVYFLFLVLELNQQITLKAWQNRTADLDAELNTRKEESAEVKAFAQRLETAGRLIKDHKIWSKVLAELERLTTAETKHTLIEGESVKNKVTATFDVGSLKSAADMAASIENVADENKTMFSQVFVKTAKRNENASSVPGQTSTPAPALAAPVYSVSAEFTVFGSYTLEGFLKDQNAGANISPEAETPADETLNEGA